MSVRKACLGGAGFAVAIFALAAAAPASAGHPVIPATRYFADAQSYTPNDFQFTFNQSTHAAGTVSGSVDGEGSASAGISNLNGGSISLQIAGTNNVYTADADLNYYFRIDGPAADPNIAITAMVYAHGESAASGSGRAGAFFNLFDPFVGSEFLFSPNPGDESQPSSWDIASAYTFHLNTIYMIQLDVHGQVNFDSVFADGDGVFPATTPGTASAFVDPQIILDPDFGQYHIVGGLLGVPDTDNTGGVPEPATWALMLGGFGLAGAVLRRRRWSPPKVGVFRPSAA